MMARMKSNENVHVLLMGIYYATATLDKGLSPYMKVLRNLIPDSQNVK